ESVTSGSLPSLTVPFTGLPPATMRSTASCALWPPSRFGSPVPRQPARHARRSAAQGAVEPRFVRAARGELSAMQEPFVVTKPLLTCEDAPRPVSCAGSPLQTSSPAAAPARRAEDACWRRNTRRTRNDAGASEGPTVAANFRRRTLAVQLALHVGRG